MLINAGARCSQPPQLRRPCSTHGTMLAPPRLHCRRPETLGPTRRNSGVYAEIAQSLEAFEAEMTVFDTALHVRVVIGEAAALLADPVAFALARSPHLSASCTGRVLRIGVEVTPSHRLSCLRLVKKAFARPQFPCKASCAGYALCFRLPGGMLRSRLMVCALLALTLLLFGMLMWYTSTTSSGIGPRVIALRQALRRSFCYHCRFTAPSHMLWIRLWCTGPAGLSVVWPSIPACDPPRSAHMCCEVLTIRMGAS